MVAAAERERLRQEKEAEKQRIRETKEAARVERELKRQQEVAEKEKKRKEREALEAEREQKRREKEVRRQQEEAKKQQVEAEKEQRRREKEALEAEKESRRKERELKRQQDEAEKELKRKEKEDAERKKQLLLQKQANIMAKMFRRKETDTVLTENASTEQQSPERNPNVSADPATAEVISRLDEELRSTCSKSEDELLRSHVEKWKSRSSQPFRRWGLRQTPKVAASSELRLQGTGMSSSRKTDSLANGESEAPASSLKRKRPEDESLEDNIKLEVLDDDADVICSPARKKQCGFRWKLLQFDKSHRPAYYGTISKVSSTIGPRHPLARDPSLDYEVDSDEEWEEEDPGESLSDCEDKEDESEKVEVESDEDAADGFVVPDGYLSENEGVNLEHLDLESSREFLTESGSVKESLGSADPMGRKRHQQMKLLDDVIKHALHRNRPFLASDLQPGEKCLNAENQTERLCFQALRMCVVAPDIVITAPAIRS